MPVGRRDALLAGGLAVAGLGAGCARRPGPLAVAGEIVGANAALGHRLRDGGLPNRPAPSPRRTS